MFLDIVKRKYTVYSVISAIFVTLAFMITMEYGPRLQEYIVDELECRVYEELGIPVDLNYNGIMKFEASKVEENSKETKFESEYVKMYGETEESAEMFELGEGIQDKEE